MASEKTKILKYSIVLLIVIALIAGVFTTFETIKAGERGVVLEWGAYDRVLGEGFHVINPISEEVIVMDVRVKKLETDANAASKDLQVVQSTVALNYHVDPVNVGYLYQNVGEDYEYQVIAPAIQEAVKAGVAKYNAEELISQRPKVKESIRQDLQDRLEKFHLKIDDFSIVNFEFSQEFNKSIEAKQIAEQEALKAENDLKRIEIEAQQKIEEAQAEAEAIKIQAEAITQQGGKDYVQLKAVEAWNGVLPQYILGSGTVPFINIPSGGNPVAQ